MPQPTTLYGPSGAPLLVDGNLVNSGSQAARTSIRPTESTGAYSISGNTGTIGATAGAVIIASFRWADATRLCLVKRVRLSAGWVATTFTAGATVAELLFARAYSVNDGTGGTLQTITTNSAKRRSSHLNTLLGSFTMSTTGALSGGTRVTDANPLACLASAVLATDGAPVFPYGELWDAEEDGKYPLVLAASEGLLVRFTAPATGTHRITVDVDWEEVATY